MHNQKVAILTIVLLCSMFVPINCLNAQPKQKAVIPDTPAGNQLKDWLRVFTSGNQDDFVRFIAEHYSKSLLEQDTAIDRAGGQARAYLDARSFEIRGTEKSTAQEITVVAQA